jgi:hypothetical protein
MARRHRGDEFFPTGPLDCGCLHSFPLTHFAASGPQKQLIIVECIFERELAF